MSFMKQYDQEMQVCAVRMVDKLISHGSSQAAARREIGTLLDINPSTLRNWFRRGMDEGITSAAGAESTDAELTGFCRENEQL